MIKQRIKKFWQKIGENVIQPSAFLVSNPKNIFYLTGFKGEGILLCSPGMNYLITDSRYTEQARQEARYCQIIIQEMKQADAQSGSLRELMEELKMKELGFESDSLLVSHYFNYQSLMPQVKLFPFQKIIETMRIIKDAREIDMMVKATQIAHQSFIKTLHSLRAGISELAVAARLNYHMRNQGAQREAFDFIVTSGERGTLIHGGPSDKKIEEGEFIVIDFGSVYKMYHSDCTRTVLLGNAGREQLRIFEVVKKTQVETLGQVKAGMKCSDLDHFARQMIAKSGYGDYFGHSLGHGVGLDIHELPRLSQYDESILQPGMVVTVEPGIYIPHVGGVRIEDTVVVTDKGCQPLDLLSKTLSVDGYFQENICDEIVI